jgi:hypothetical protein
MSTATIKMHVVKMLTKEGPRLRQSSVQNFARYSRGITGASAYLSVILEQLRLMPSHERAIVVVDKLELMSQLSDMITRVIERTVGSINAQVPSDERAQILNSGHYDIVLITQQMFACMNVHCVAMNLHIASLTQSPPQLSLTIANHIRYFKSGFTVNLYAVIDNQGMAANLAAIQVSNLVDILLKNKVCDIDFIIGNENKSKMLDGGTEFAKTAHYLKQRVHRYITQFSFYDWAPIVHVPMPPVRQSPASVEQLHMELDDDDEPRVDIFNVLRQAGLTVKDKIEKLNCDYKSSHLGVAETNKDEITLTLTFKRNGSQP